MAGGLAPALGGRPASSSVSAPLGSKGCAVIPAALLGVAAIGGMVTLAIIPAWLAGSVAVEGGDCVELFGTLPIEGNMSLSSYTAQPTANCNADARSTTAQ